MSKSLHDDQAHQLRQVMQEEELLKELEKEREEQDYLNLPPRSEAHTDSKRLFKKTPLIWIRMLVTIFLLLIVSILLYTYWNQPNDKPPTIEDESKHEFIIVGAQTCILNF
ncbi:hypothetical protein [Pontibacillus litoralis]|uniref:Uncharacterized protein n=1 Tax=Pontibacillus litoralis JSM 072002 TaxID=1385512 RepID=A0A0A5HR08_9BACI|nr:hypothetical protein [Pontibacillus litoralis]KGX86012.1 hypothetical protein N784_06115 [Pontibacillus litoralis JSM 072002]